MTLDQIKTPPGQKPAWLFKLLSWYPFIWTALILFYGLFRLEPLISIAMLTWVAVLYLGSPAWLSLLVYLTIKRRLNKKQILLHIAILLLGIGTAILVTEYDILRTGVKNID